MKDLVCFLLRRKDIVSSNVMYWGLNKVKILFYKVFILVGDFRGKVVVLLYVSVVMCVVIGNGGGGCKNIFYRCGYY